MPNWNPQQEKAIYTMHKNILVSASAGSGKTTVLIARLLHLVKDKRIEIDRILAMTFTEAAANEMKKRLAKELQDALIESKDEEERNYLNKQLANMSKAYISTIHGFCLQIIKNYYYAIGLDKESITNIMDESSTQQLLAQSMEESFAQFIDDKNFLILCQMFSTKADSNVALQEAILSLFHLASAKSDPHAFLAQCKKKKMKQMSDYSFAIQTYFYDYLLVQVDSLIDALTQARYYYDELTEMEPLNEKLIDLSHCKSALQNKNYTSFRELFLKQSMKSIKKVKEQPSFDELKKEIENLEKNFIAIAFEEDTFIAQSNANIPYINTFIDVCTFFLDCYTQHKRELKYIDFSDMEHFALQILDVNEQMVAKRYQQHFYEIMVDEFQDSNDVQDRLVKLICKENNVFRVGDIKQSIYGFRHATPDIMRSLIDQKNEQDEVIYLNFNYRSKKSIVDFNNQLFDKLMNIHGFSSSFSENDCTQIGLETQKEDNVTSELHLISEKKINEGRFQKYSKDELKASYIASKIIEMKQTKGYQYKDFVVLVKTNAKSECLRSAFEALNIPYFINMKHGFYDSSALQNVIAFLKVLNNPHDDIAMCALLLSPFFQKDNEYLAQIKLAKEKHMSYYQYLSKQEAFPAFYALLKDAHTQKVSELLKSIYYYNNYYEDYTTKQEKSNLDKLFEMVCMKEANQSLSLFAFITMIEESKNTQIGEAIPISNNDDVVRVMSIHQSKGLQFPVVFLYSVDRLNLFDTKGLIAFDDELGIALNYMHLENRLVYTGVERIALNHKATKNALEEEMRVLYVATTRAQKEMYIVDCKEEKAVNELSKIEIYKKNSFTSWILQAYQHNVENLFTIRYIDSLLECDRQPSLESSTQTIEKYSYPIKNSYTLSPSESEVFTFTPSRFRLDEDVALKRGSDLHKMIETLPNIAWNETILQQMATMNQITLTKHDIDILLALNTNPIYQHSFFGEVHHELPFMVNDKDTIIHGYMDYVSILNTEIILIDFKSDRYVSADELVKRYHVQLETYQKALTILYPDKIVNAYLYSFELQQMIPIHKNG
ncbi:MAG: helicase [Erysipelotrichia bacterium]|nr:helicase [Erysipelotrichia bacterium]NCC54471.1 helicase [Erysipelotrichia bacterium]